MRFRLLLILLGTPLVAGASQRTFLMGTSTFADFFEFKFENLSDKDLYAVHVDDFLGIPWDNFKDHSTLPASWVSRVASISQGAAASQKIIYLSLGPLTDRMTLAGNVNAAGAIANHWAPQDASGCYLFDSAPNHDAYKQAYIDYVKYMVEAFHPTFLGIVVEMNMQFTLCPSQKAAFKQWYTDVYRAVKAEYPSLVVFPTHQLDFMNGTATAAAWCGGVKTDASIADCFQQRLDEINVLPADRMAFSIYPAGWKGPPTPPDTFTNDVPLEMMFSRVRQATSRKIWISETGWPGVEIRGSYFHASPASACGPVVIPVPIIAGDTMMATYMSHLLAQAQSKQFEAVVWWSDRDFLDGSASVLCPCPSGNPTCDLLETLYVQGGASLETLSHFFGNMGIRQKDGNPRSQTYAVWTSYFSQPFSPVPGGNSLDQIQVYPNPLRPARGHKGMHFDQLPPGAKLRIYTLAGEKVNELTANTVGQATWDGTNGAGQKAASGVYLVYIQAAGDSKTVKVAVQR